MPHSGATSVNMFVKFLTAKMSRSFFLDLGNVCFVFFLSFQGCSWSVIFVDLDAHNRNRQTLCSLLPRESRSHVRYFYTKLIRNTTYDCFLKTVLKMLEVARRNEEREVNVASHSAVLWRFSSGSEQSCGQSYFVLGSFVGLQKIKLTFWGGGLGVATLYQNEFFGHRVLEKCFSWFIFLLKKTTCFVYFLSCDLSLNFYMPIVPDDWFS